MGKIARSKERQGQRPEVHRTVTFRKELLHTPCSIGQCLSVAAVTRYLGLCGLKNRDLLFSQFWMLEIQDQDAHKVGVW